MSMTKMGVIDENTPQSDNFPPIKPVGCCGGGCKPKTMTKESADQIEDSAATRAANAVADVARQTRQTR